MLRCRHSNESTLLLFLQVLARVPNAILRAKFGAGSALLCGVVEAKQVRSFVAAAMVRRAYGQAGCCEL